MEQLNKHVITLSLLSGSFNIVCGVFVNDNTDAIRDTVTGIALVVLSIGLHIILVKK